MKQAKDLEHENIFIFVKNKNNLKITRASMSSNCVGSVFVIKLTLSTTKPWQLFLKGSYCWPWYGWSTLAIRCNSVREMFTVLGFGWNNSFVSNKVRTLLCISVTLLLKRWKLSSSILQVSFFLKNQNVKGYWKWGALKRNGRPSVISALAL